MDRAAGHVALTPESPPRKHWAWGAALPGEALIAGVRLLREHRNPVAGSWPYLLLSAGPLMHLFHGHGGHGKHDSPRRRNAQD